MVPWYFRLLKLEFRTFFELKSTFDMEDMNESIGWLCFPNLDTQNMFVKNKLLDDSVKLL